MKLSEFLSLPYHVEIIDDTINIVLPDEIPELCLASKAIKIHRPECSRIVFLNTSIITTPGTFEFSPVSLKEVKELIQYSNAPLLSAVGHESTALIMSELLAPDQEFLEIPRAEYIKVNRIQYEQRCGDFAIVFKLNNRPPEGKILSREEIEQIGYSWGLLLKKSWDAVCDACTSTPDTCGKYHICEYRFS